MMGSIGFALYRERGREREKGKTVSEAKMRR